MKKIYAYIFCVFLLVTMAGCGIDSTSVDSLIDVYFSEKLSDAEYYSIDIIDQTEITKSDDDYKQIIDYVTNEFNCKERNITELQEIEVNVKAYYSYDEEYTSYFIVGKIKGKLKILDKDDGAWSNGYGYGGRGGSGDGKMVWHFG